MKPKKYIANYLIFVRFQDAQKKNAHRQLQRVYSFITDKNKILIKIIQS